MENIATYTFTVINSQGNKEALDQNKINIACQEACEGLPAANWNDIAIRSQVEWYDNIHTHEIQTSVIMASKSLIETHPDYNYATARLLLRQLKKKCKYNNFTDYIKGESEESGLLDPVLSESFDLEKLESALNEENDKLFKYIGLQMLSDRYLVKDKNQQLCELPQWFWMRVAMGIALAEKADDRTRYAIEFYNLISQFLYIPSTPTLFNSGTKHPQLSSCYLNTVEDDLAHIFKVYGDCAQLSKWAGGIGTYWGHIRGTNSHIKGTNGASQGLIPWLKIFNDTALAVNQGGKRKGSFCAYIEPWHIDFPDFLELRKNVGDERRRTHDINTASWIPDLFMERMLADLHWTLFCPSQVKDLPDLYGNAFKERYEYYEAEFEAGKINGQRIQAKDLWRKMLSMIFETGHPWVTFKDACNIRNPQSHSGIVHSSNLCVAPDTYVLTSTGQHRIIDLVNQNVEVWNGLKFSPTTIRKTGEQKQLMTVSLSNGVEIKCTPEHRFYTVEDYAAQTKDETVIIEAQHLKLGTKLIKYELPVIDNNNEYLEAYASGFFSGDGCSYKGDSIIHFYGAEKRALIDKKFGHLIKHRNEQNSLNRETVYLNRFIQKFEVPINYSRQSKLEWFAGLCDSDGTVARNGSNESLQIASINKEFLEQVRLMLQTLGVDSKVTPSQAARSTLLPDGKGGKAYYDCKPLYRLLVNSIGTKKLYDLNLPVNRLNLSGSTPNRDASRFIEVLHIEFSTVEDTYCFTEKERGMGMFNGVLTGQCTEITLNTSAHETAVCNLGSINIGQHVKDGQIDWETLRKTIRTAIRMLDNVIDINYYPTEESKAANNQHRPIGLGIMGYQDALHKLTIPFDSNEHLNFSNTLYEFISYSAIRSSMRLAHERGQYQSFEGSDWSRGVLPIDTHDELLNHRDEANRIQIKEIVPPPSLDWDSLRHQLLRHGMRNSNTMAIAPTASISFLVGASSCIEPTFKNLYVTSNLSGEFTMINENLVRDLEKLNLWNEETAEKLKAYDGNLSKIEGIPDHIIATYKEVFEIDQHWILKAAAVRGLWIDQAQSLNLFVKSTSGKLLHDLYTTAWKLGIKTTYYLRTLGASQVEKSTVDTSVYGNTHKRNRNSDNEEPAAIPQCRIDQPDCEACQ